jgi:hypothetical protein
MEERCTTIFFLILNQYKKKLKSEQKIWENKKKTEKTEPWKKSIKILKKLVGLVWFQFYKSKTEKTEPNRIQTEKIKKKLSKIEKTEQNRFWFFLKKILIWFFFIKTES